jgi:hypothetical protein
MPMPVSRTATSMLPFACFAETSTLAAVGRELHRVRQQVQHDLLELALVGLQLAQLLIDPPR